MKIKNCVVRTWSLDHTHKEQKLIEKLSDGWIVKYSVPFIDCNGRTEFVEYILEKQDE